MNKKIIAIIVLILILVSIPLTIYLVKRQQELRLKAAPATVLSVSPATVEKTVGDIFNINIQIDTGDNQVVGADLYLSFNSLVLEALTITPGGFFDSPQELTKNIDNQTGKIVYSLGSFTPKQGLGILASISFKAKSEGTSSLAFDSGTSVAGIGETEALQNTIPGSITVVVAEATPTPTPTPTPTSPPGTPTPTPTSPPGTTPTPTSEPTPTPTSGTGGPGPTSTPTPTPTTVVRTTLTPTPTTSPEELPEAGNITPTFILIGFGILVLTSGLLLLF